ncbi:response regulator [Bacillus sp. 37MA]|uniref:response regulator n=1 Tax=Bacillus sp. 37MA TaxID=1132442 RepID=UPI00037730AA|nr:response regulator [Bacillus sp. 37MA]
MTFKKKLFLAFGIIYGIDALMHIYVGTRMVNFNQEMENFTKSNEVLMYANIIQDGLNDYSKESRDLIANPPEDLQGTIEVNRDQDLQDVNLAINSLEKLEKSEESQEIVENLKATMRTYAEIDKEMSTLIKEGKNEEAAQLYWYKARESMDNMNEVAFQLKNRENSIAAENSIEINKTYNQIFIIAKVYVSVSYLLGLTMLLFIRRNVTSRLNKVSSVMSEVNFNSLNKLPRIHLKTKDEIGKIAISFNEMAEALETHTRQEKELKNAAEKQSWLKTKIAEIATMYPGIDNVETLAHIFITKVTPMVRGAYGVIYIKEDTRYNGSFQKLAAYADHYDNQQEVGASSFRLGEGIVGQCALENRIISLNQVPEDYIKITSGLGSARPSNVLVLPAEFQGEVLAVIELASFEPFNDLEEMLLQEVMSNLGTNIKSILRHMQVEKLLQESQALTEELQSQSEELQSQQEELRNVNEQLEEQYEHSEQKTKEVEKVKDILEEKAQQLTLSSQYKSEFLANMSHELRTPLNSLLILAQMLTDNVDGNLTDKQVSYAKTIYSSGNDLLHLINDILDIVKIEAGKTEVISKDVELTNVKEFVEAQFTPVARKKNIQLHVQLASDLPEVIHTDKQRLQQILKNLLSNAFKFTEHGAVTLTIEKAEKGMFSKEKEDAFTHSNIEFVFSVKDTGIGIATENQDIIFDAFKQADGTISRKYGGTGLGLSISRELAQLLGGFIEVESIEGYGSTFTLYLPHYQNIVKEEGQNIARKEIAHSEAEAATTHLENSSNVPVVSAEYPFQTEDSWKQIPERKALLEGKKILVVDDDMRNVFALTTALESYQVEVMFAENGKDGITVLQGNPDIDLVIMDIMMPEMDGFETIRVIRQLPEFQSLPIIALTAKAMKNDRKECIEAGASDYISKPVNLDQLFSIIRVWLYR